MHGSLFILLGLMILLMDLTFSLLMDLTLSFSNCLYTFLVISKLMDVFMVFFSFTLTGVMSTLKHFNLNLL